MKLSGCAILLTLTLPCLAEARSSRILRAESDIRQIECACQTFQDEYGVFPPNTNWLAELTATTNASVNRHKIVFIELPSGVDVWGNPFVYRCPGLNRPDSFDVYSLGADGRSVSNGNDPDDINSWNKDRPWRKYYHPPLVTPLRAVIIVGVMVLAVIVVRKKQRTKQPPADDHSPRTGAGFGTPEK